jgi:plasmid stability protein
MPVRLPTSTVERLRVQAAASGCSLSDALRAHLTLAEAKPLGKPRPRRREPKKLAAVSGADPELMRELAGLGNNMNQLARSVNGGLLGGKPIECLQILASMRAIEREIMLIADRHAH